MRPLRARFAIAMCCALPTLAACIAEPADSDPTAAVGGEDTPFEELGAVAIAEPSTGTAASIDKDDANKSISIAIWQLCRIGRSPKWRRREGETGDVPRRQVPGPVPSRPLHERIGRASPAG